MRTRVGRLATTLLALGLAASAGAVQTMNAQQLDALLIDNTFFVELAAGGTATIHFSANGRAAGRMPGGAAFEGQWAIEDDRYCIDWNEGPQNSCTQLVRGEEDLVLIDPATGEARGVLRKIERDPGNTPTDGEGR